MLKEKKSKPIICSGIALCCFYFGFKSSRSRCSRKYFNLHV